ncbi:single-stranded DNA exonuclease [Saccharolobus caldissimus]|uniref:Single-stranded DNA exonuclease n=1 Tax=Saccharolobus caldissimus TaxID=1702097 RepID=A0AAQ4CN11_9CREN|nr:single-stranded DNA exonuclease [Saccharolobus caldissimus]BDB97192.1 hypothetical protein SACC_02090 [Saccharolobus caldissimus]
MEVFLGEPNHQEIREFVRNIQPKDNLCISTYYSPDPILFSYIISKYIKNLFILSFNSKNCEIELKMDNNGKWLLDNKNGKKYFLGQNSYCSYLSITTDDVLPTLTGIISSTIVERRKLTEWELNIIKDLGNLGVIVEKNLKIPGYKTLPLFLSLMLSIDPYIPGLTGNRENTINMIKEINLNEVTRLDELNESQLNTLLFRIISLIIKENPKFSRDDIITERVFYLDYDILELAFSAIYFFDTIGSSELLQLSLSSSYAEILIDKFRQTFSKGFTLNLIDSKQSYYLIEAKNFDSPLMAQLIFLQLQKIRKDKIIILKRGDNYYTSRYFIKIHDREGVVKIDDRIKNIIGM